MMYYHITERILQAMTSGLENVFFRSTRTSCTTFRLSFNDLKERLLQAMTSGYENVFVGPLQRVRPRNGILCLVVVVVVLPLRSEFIGEL